MIEKMKKVTLFCLAKNRRATLVALRKAGVLHIDSLAQKSQAIDTEERNIQSVSTVLSVLEDNVDKKHPEVAKLVSPKEVEELNKSLLSLLDKRKKCEEELFHLTTDRDMLKPWGDFSISDIKTLEESGVKLYFYTLGKKELQALITDENITFVRLKEVNKQNAIAVVDKPLDLTFPANALTLPSLSLADIELELKAKEAELAGYKKEIVKATAYIPSYKAYLKVLGQNLEFEKADATAEDAEDIVSYLTGWIPEPECDHFKKVSAENGWAYIISDPTEEDNPPTLIKYKGIVRVVKPIFDMLGTVPGYREYDISLYFLLFFSVFFAMIIGDAGYGLIFLIVGVIMQIKSKKLTDANILLYILSVVTIVWGALTGTWFGSSMILQKLPFLKALVFKPFANYPELFNDPVITQNYTQNMMMKFSFMLGALQLSLGSIINIITKIKEKNLSLFSDIGWLMETIVLYGLALNLVIKNPNINTDINYQMVFTVIGIGFVLVCAFGAQKPGVPFVKGLLSGLGGFFTTFLDTISCFSNIMSYIRLFAVGMASLAIAQSFNNMAAGIVSGSMLMLPAGMLIVFVGHALNIVMGLLSVVVHGVRLNLMEFSGRLGMEWSGYQYEPFKETVNENVVGNN